MSLHESIVVFSQEENNPLEEYEAAYDSGGKQKMYFYMNWSISNLSIIHREHGLGRSMTDDEKILHRNEFRLVKKQTN